MNIIFWQNILNSKYNQIKVELVLTPGGSGGRSPPAAAGGKSGVNNPPPPLDKGKFDLGGRGFLLNDLM